MTNCHPGIATHRRRCHQQDTDDLTRRESAGGHRTPSRPYFIPNLPLRLNQTRRPGTSVIRPIILPPVGYQNVIAAQAKVNKALLRRDNAAMLTAGFSQRLYPPSGSIISRALLLTASLGIGLQPNGRAQG